MLCGGVDIRFDIHPDDSINHASCYLIISLL